MTRAAKPSRAAAGAGYPFVQINAAMTADGKIAPANRVFKSFGGKRDLDLLYRLRAGADAVMAGARTVDLFPATLGSGGKKYRRMRLRNGLSEESIRIVATGSGTLNPDAEIFKHRFPPIIILASESIPQNKLKVLRGLADGVGIFGRSEIDFDAAMRWLRTQWNVKKLVCEGGGGLNDAVLRAGRVDEIFVTVCPLIFGGAQSPTLADGVGFGSLAKAMPLQLKSMRRVNDDLFLVFTPDRQKIAAATAA